jgi:type IV pilus secretin PilQ/predicted competence protein
MRAKLAWALLAASTMLMSTAARAEDQSPTAITEIRHEATDAGTRISVASNGALAYTYYSPDPLTLVIDVPDVDASRLPARIAVGSKEIESIHVSSLARAGGPAMTRIEARLASLAPYQIASKDNSLDVVFERAVRVSEAEPAPQPAPAAPVSAPEPAPVPAAQVPAAEPAIEAPVAARGPASRITRLVESGEGDSLAFDVQADGQLEYQDFFLSNPDRLVVDFRNVTSRAPVRLIEVNRGPVRKVRLAQFSTASPRVARLVVDLANRTPYRIVEAGEGVRIVFGEGDVPAPAPLAALRTEPEEVPAEVAPVRPVPAAARATMNESVQFQSLPAMPTGALQEAPAAPTTPSVSTNANPLGTARQYTGHPISLDFKDGDLQDIFRLFADISGLNVVVNPGVSGKVTLKLNEVPWDQALDLILKANGLGYTLEDNVIRIAKLSDLQAEETALRKLQEEKALTGTLVDYTRSLSYAKAAELQQVLRAAGALSARGSITLDPRTNTMIIRDLPIFVEKSKALIDELDRATPQVEIEARIVVTSRNFTRDLGIQWGFLQQRTSAFGNTTELAFPNSVIVNGSGVPSTSGLPPGQGDLGANAGLSTAGRGYAVNLPAAGFNSALGISLGNILGNFNVDLALTALERQGRGRLLSTPKVTTQNNMPAEIKQGVQIPIQTVANNTVTVSFKDAVLTLKVTPQITEAGTVILQVEVENNAADFANLVNGIPPINTQSAKTQVLVRDGATAVIGGIYQSNEQTAQSNTPLLNRLPVLGYLFRNRFVTTSNNELLLFITPRIIKG